MSCNVVRLGKSFYLLMVAMNISLVVTPIVCFVISKQLPAFKRSSFSLKTMGVHLGPIRMAGGGSENSKMENIYTVMGESPAVLQACIQQERGEAWADDLSALILFSLGFDSASLHELAAAASSKGATVFYADCYGIIGYSTKEGRNVELMVHAPHCPSPCRDASRMHLYSRYFPQSHLHSRPRSHTHAA